MATTGYTVFITYQFESTGYTSGTSYGYPTTLHCGNITRIETDDIKNKGINLYFSADEFPFLVQPSGSTTGEGWSAHKFNAIAQIVTGTDDDAVPVSYQWRKIDLTDQINGHTVGDPISGSSVSATLFSFSQLLYNNSPYYDLSYINHPSSGATDANKMSFGEEVFFFGNITTDIKATAYSTDIPIVLPLNEFNSTTNETWGGAGDVLISEIGIYDENDNLVAIGKFSEPIAKNSDIARTLLFGMDF